MKQDLGYSQFLQRHGLTEQAVWELMDRLPPSVPHPLVDEAFTLSPSPVHGVGLFAIRSIAEGEWFPCVYGAERYRPARYTNHSDVPNAVLHFKGIDGVIEILTPLQPGDEVLMDYNDNIQKSLAASSNPPV